MIALLTARLADVPEDDAWLVASEPATLAALRMPGRRADWRLGRWVAKQAVAAVLGVPAAEVEVRAAADGAPEPRRGGTALPAAISISHRGGVAVCAVAAPPVPLGCDLELVEPRAPVFAEEWFGADERTTLATASPAERDLLVTVIWSAKESALKARRCGLRGDPRFLEVRSAAVEASGWHRLTVRDDERSPDLDAWWRPFDTLVLTVAAPSLPSPPVLLAERR